MENGGGRGFASFVRWGGLIFDSAGGCAEEPDQPVGEILEGGVLPAPHKILGQFLQRHVHLEFFAKLIENIENIDGIHAQRIEDFGIVGDRLHG